MARRITVAAVSMALEERRPLAADENIRHVDNLMSELAPIQPDLVVLPEIYLTAGLPERGQAEPQSTTHLRRLAERYHTQVAGSLYQERDGKLYNCMIMADRTGVLVGRYDKMHPIEGEMARGISPGALDQTPIATTLGLISGQICFDANWPAGWHSLADQGTDLILFPSAFAAGRLLTSLAAINTVTVVPAVWTRHAGIISNTGDWLARTDRFCSWAAASIDLERTVFHWDDQGHLLPQIIAAYGPRLQIETFGEEAWFVLTPTDAGPGIDEVIGAFGLVTYRQYIRRAGAAQRAAPESRKEG